MNNNNKFHNLLASAFFTFVYIPYAAFDSTVGKLWRDRRWPRKASDHKWTKWEVWPEDSTTKSRKCLKCGKHIIKGVK